MNDLSLNSEKFNKRVGKKFIFRFLVLIDKIKYVQKYLGFELLNFKKICYNDFIIEIS